MRVLLDTHVVVWAGLNSPSLSRKSQHFLLHADEVFVSAASAWEIATKVRLGRWVEAQPLEASFSEHMRSAGFTMVGIAAEVALRAGRLSGKRGDPFDRMIAAQALALDVPVVSIDGQLDEFGVKRIW